MSDLIKRLRNYAAKQDKEVWMHCMREAAETLEANAALIALLRASLRKAEDEVEGLRKDAERYRWIRPRATSDDGYYFLPSVFRWATKPGPQFNEQFANLDAAIDAALANQKEG